MTMYYSSGGAMRSNCHLNVRYILLDDATVEHYLFSAYRIPMHSPDPLDSVSQALCNWANVATWPVSRHDVRQGWWYEAQVFLRKDAALGYFLWWRCRPPDRAGFSNQI